MVALVPDSFLYHFRKDQKRMIYDLSQDVVVGFEENLSVNCPNCVGDYINDLSLGLHTAFSGSVVVFSGTLYERTITPKPFRKRCPVCKGKGVITVPNEKIMRIHVQWNPRDGRWLDRDVNTSVGEAGQVKVRLKTDSKYYNDFFHAKYFIINGVKVIPIGPPMNRGMGDDDGIVHILAATEDHDRKVG
jgi:hypothetical protein